MAHKKKDIVVSKIVKSNLRGVLLSKVDGVALNNLLSDYEFVTNENLDYKNMGFRHIKEFIQAVPDVARIVNNPGAVEKVFGIALNELNITANKSCFKPRAGATNETNNNTNIFVKTNLNNELGKKINNQMLPKVIPPMDTRVSYDFRSSFLKDTCPEFGVLKYNPQANLTNGSTNVKNGFHEQQKQQQNKKKIEPMPNKQHQNMMNFEPMPNKQHQNMMKNDHQQTFSRNLKYDNNYNKLSNGNQKPMQSNNTFDKKHDQQKQQHEMMVNNINRLCATKYFSNGVNNNTNHSNENNNSLQSQVSIAKLDNVDSLRNLKPIEQNDSSKMFQAIDFGNIPSSMTLMMLQLMTNDVRPGTKLPRRSEYPSCIDIMLTHVEPQSENYFWGIVTHPYHPSLDDVLSLDKHKNKFEKYNGGKRAVVLHQQQYYSRVWVKSIQRNMASVFMVDFGNTEMIPVDQLETPPTTIWDFHPIAIPFRHQKNFNLVKQINQRYRCRLLNGEGYIFEVDNMELI